MYIKNIETKFSRDVTTELRKKVDKYFDFFSLPIKDQNLDVLQGYYDWFRPKLDRKRKTKVFKLACGNNQLESAQ